MTSFRNDILAQLESQSILRLRLSEMNLASNETLQDQGHFIHRIFFLEEGLASLATTAADGYEIECDLIGRDRLLNSAALLGAEASHLEISNLVAGRAHSCRVLDARAEFARGELFSKLVLCGIAHQQALMAQRILFAAHHDASVRVAGWLLACRNLSDAKILPLTHVRIARALGIQRATVTTILGRLEEDGIVATGREQIGILDEGKLKAIGGSCVVSRLS